MGPHLQPLSPHIFRYMKTFLLSTKAVWLLCAANLMAVAGFFIIKANGGFQTSLAMTPLFGLGLSDVLFFAMRSKAK